MKRDAIVILAAFLTLISSVSGDSKAWGPEGHECVARIAELNLSADAKDAIRDLLPDVGFSGSNVSFRQAGNM